MRGILKNKLAFNFHFILFSIFSVSNFLITYTPSTYLAKICIFLFGILFPTLFIFNTLPRVTRPGKTIFPTESFALTSWGAALPWVALALLFRFWRVNSPDRWAGGDEVLTGMTALDMLHHWDYKFFQTLGEIPTGLAQFTSILFQITHQPFFSLYFPPAFVSALSLWVGYNAARQFFSKSLSILILGLFAFNFWALFAARIPYTASFFSLWEFGAFYFLGGFLNPRPLKSRSQWASGLALWMGLGFLTSALWMIVALLILLILLKSFLNQDPRNRSSYWIFCAVLIPSLILLFYAATTEGYCRHLFSITLHRNSTPLSQWTQSITDYFSALFWQVPPGQFPLITGGFLNLFSASLFFLGILQLFRQKKEALTDSLAFAFILFFAGAFMASGIETFRIFELLPILLVIAAVGLQSLLLTIPPARRTWVLILVFLVLAGVDAARLFHSFQPKGTIFLDLKSDPQRCYEILESLSKSRGPGIIMGELVPEDTDHSLTYYSYPFNAGLNPELSAENIKWLAVYTRQYYVSPLAKRFPSAQWVQFPAGATLNKSRNVLGLIPLQPQTIKILVQWKNFYTFYQNINLKIMELGNGLPRKDVLMNLAEYYPKVPDDPFLQSCFFEKLLFNYTWEKNFHPEDVEANWKNFSTVLCQSFQKSYQDVNLCEKYGRLLAMEGNFPEARKAFKQALTIYPGNEWLQTELRQLDSPN